VERKGQRRDQAVRGKTKNGSKVKDIHGRNWGGEGCEYNMRRVLVESRERYEKRGREKGG